MISLDRQERVIKGLAYECFQRWRIYLLGLGRLRLRESLVSSLARDVSITIFGRLTSWYLTVYPAANRKPALNGISSSHCRPVCKNV